ncbi:MAG: hypothetical protein IJC52_00420 [Clostridia bacterium]|nr:hypothetical protein [Clostridia bacterium]
MNRLSKALSAAVYWLTVAALLLSMSGTPVFAATLRGDTTGDGQRNMSDALVLYNAASGTVNTPALNVGDVDGNNVINMLDALALYAYASNGTPLPVVAADVIKPIAHTSRYGRKKLVAAGQLDMVDAYDYLHQQVNAHKETIDLYSYGLTIPQAQRVIRYYRDDHPEVFWLTLAYSYRYSGSTFYDVTFDYAFTSSQVASYKKQLASVTEQMLSGITAQTDPADRARIVHNRLIQRAQYDKTYAKANSHNLLGVLIDKTGVCESYSLAYEYLMHQCGIQAGVVVGQSQGIGHMWNFLYLNGNWYQTDVTWDDPIVNSTHDWSHYYTYTYFNTTTAQMLTDHTIQTEYSTKNSAYAITYPVPTCTATAENYQLKIAKSVSYYNASAMAPILANAIKNNKPAVFLATGGYAASSLEAELKSDMSAMIGRMNSYLRAAERVRDVKYILKVNATHNTLEVFLD